MPQILDHNGHHALLPFNGKHHDGDSTLLRVMAKTTVLSTPVIDTANDISPLADGNMRFLQGLDLGKTKITGDRENKLYITSKNTLYQSRSIRPN
jgi:hypothetical protein